MGLTSAPATESIMGAVSSKASGVGSAVNDTTRLVGGTLGVAAVIGTSSVPSINTRSPTSSADCASRQAVDAAARIRPRRYRRGQTTQRRRITARPGRSHRHHRRVPARSARRLRRRRRRRRPRGHRHWDDAPIPTGREHGRRTNNVGDDQPRVGRALGFLLFLGQRRDELRLIEACVGTLASEQILMRALLDDCRRPP